MKHFIIILTTLSLSVFEAVHAQEIISSGGDYLKNTTGSVIYTIGEPICETFKGTTAFLTQGFLGFSSVYLSVYDLPGLIYSIEVTPNPAREFTILKVKPIPHNNLFFGLYDLNGKLLQMDQVVNENTKISIGHLAPSTYFISVSEDRTIVKTLIILKQN